MPVRSERQNDMWGTAAVDMAYTRGIRGWNEMSCAFHKDVGPVALLVHNAADLAVVVYPGRRRLARKALYATEGRVL